MSQDLYQELIIDHSQSPRNFGKLANCTHEYEGINHLCGDKIKVELIIDQNIIKKIKFSGQGCAISKAASSIMTETVKGKNIDEVLELFNEYHDLLTKDKINSEHLGKLAIFANVKNFPTRVKCATLAWHTLKAAIKK